MSFLRDRELVELIDPSACGSSALIKNLKEPTDWYGKESPVQACSVDLTIGHIFLPNVTVGDVGSIDEPLLEWSLRPGHTAIVSSTEEMNFPDNIGAFGFPPARISVRGLLMTNPGHVDPGYRGFLKFTVLNMGDTDIPLKQGSMIASLLVFRLSESAQADYSARGGSFGSYLPTKVQLDALASDFSNVEQRALEVAKEQIKKEKIVLTIVTACFAFAFTAFVFLGKTVVDVTAGIEQRAYQDKVDRYEKKVDKIESILINKGYIRE